MLPQATRAPIHFIDAAKESLAVLVHTVWRKSLSQRFVGLCHWGTQPPQSIEAFGFLSLENREDYTPKVSAASHPCASPSQQCEIMSAHLNHPLQNCKADAGAWTYKNKMCFGNFSGEGWLFSIWSPLNDFTETYNNGWKGNLMKTNLMLCILYSSLSEGTKVRSIQFTLRSVKSLRSQGQDDQHHLEWGP